MEKLETLSEFCDRTRPFTRSSLPEGGALHTNPNLGSKVDPEGRFLPFYGNTVVFCLPDSVKQRIRTVQQALYRSCPEMLAQPLDPATFHITLHDLINGTSPTLLDREMPEIQPAVRQLVDRMRTDTAPIRLQSSCLFNMVSTSMVLGFEPVDEESCRQLMAGYQQLQQVWRLDYPLTPHVTVAYFRPGVFRPDQVERLDRVIQAWRDEAPIQLELSGACLAYQLFSSMDHYWTV